MSAMYTKGIGTPGYTAPEVLIGGGGSYNGRLADVFSSGRHDRFHHQSGSRGVYRPADVRHGQTNS